MSRRVYLVTVTYGDRGRMLAELIRRCVRERWLTRIVVVSNASLSPLRDLLSASMDRIILLENAHNLGSAQAYARGIEAALRDGADYLLLMDDDNAPAPGCVDALLQELDRLACGQGIGRAAVSGFRPALQPDVARGKPTPLPSSFLGFHVRQIPHKLRLRLGRGAGHVYQVARSADLPFAAYGGLLAHRTLFESIGLPKADLVLYEDDTEYTARIREAGGTIRLFTRCVIEDLEKSWNIADDEASAATRLSRAGDPFRVFYSLRNRVWFDRHCFARHRGVYRLNKYVYLSMIAVQSLMLNRLGRLRMILHAVRDGERARLGLHPDYPLPGGG